jgi:1-acyl-sn-glycerol-3-phosphate acyltransferase
MPATLLTTASTYRTPERPRFWMARSLPGLFFYTHVARIVLQASRPARRGRYDGRRWILSSLDTIRSLESVGGRFVIEGLDILSRLDTPCVFVGNHMSILETFVLPCLIQPHRDVTFVIKESLVNYPFFGHVMKSRRPIIVGRTNPREDLKAVLDEGAARIDAGVSVIIFPQTTRSTRFDPKKFNSLGVKLARRCRVPVVPFALLTDAWGLGRRLKDFGRIRPELDVRIRFGDPLPVRGSGKEEHQITVDFIQDRLATWRRERSAPAES